MRYFIKYLKTICPLKKFLVCFCFLLVAAFADKAVAARSDTQIQTAASLMIEALEPISASGDVIVIQSDGTAFIIKSGGTKIIIKS